MDIQMPEMDGLEATKQIILQWGDQRPLIVAMTANALIEDKENCLAAGMDDYISKPLTINQVSSRMEKWALSCKLRKNNTV
jgi:CheY-like chemotaxis protein